MRLANGTDYSHINDEIEHMESLRGLLAKECALPLLTLGSGRSNLATKLQVVAQACFLVAGSSQEQLSSFMRSVDAFGGDMGTEFGVPSVKHLPATMLLPWMKADQCCTDGQEIREEDEWNVRASGQLQESTLGFETSLKIPTLMHVITNATNDCLDASPHLSNAVESLGHIARLLDSKYTLKRLLEACFKGSLGESLHADLKSWRGRVHKERWGTIVCRVCQLVKLKEILLWGWNKDSYLQMSSGNGAVSDDGLLANCDEAITSDDFWGCMTALEFLAICIEEANKWCAGCPCHGPWMKSCNVRAVSKVWETCPMRGRRAPELAAGDFIESFWNSVHNASGKLALKLSSSPLSKSLQGRIVGEFEGSTGKLLFTFTMKFGPLREPPSLLFVLGHHDEEKSHLALQRCLISDNKHPQIVELQSMEDEATSWMAGETLEALGDFSRFLCAKKFAWTCAHRDNHVAWFNVIMSQIGLFVVAQFNVVMS